MGDDLRQRYAEALAAKFTYPVYRCDKDGENEWVENPEPADRVGQTPYVMFTAGDGNRSFWTPSCTELGEVVAAVRDEEMAALRQQVERACAEERARIAAELHAEGERERERLREFKGLGPDVDPCHVSGELNNWITAWGAAARFVAGEQPKPPLIIRNQADTTGGDQP